jgi:hypothetical protein
MGRRAWPRLDRPADEIDIAFLSSELLDLLNDGQGLGIGWASGIDIPSFSKI